MPIVPTGMSTAGVAPGTAVATSVVGRDAELLALESLLENRPSAAGVTAVALEGEAGIGKSTLWRETVEAARARGLRVLTARAAETESTFAHAGLGDLFDDLLPELVPTLTPPQRRALEVALLVEDEAGAPIDTRALGVAVRTVLQSLSGDGLMLAIDDLQWLDPPSARALAFALRRMSGTDVLLIWTRRLDGRHVQSPLEDAIEPDRIHRVPVGSLSVGAIHRIVVSRFGAAIPRPTLLRLHEVSGGNPFYALELARALGSGYGHRDPTQRLRVPERLEELLAARLAAFTGSTRDALVLASADARLTTAQLRAAGIERGALDPALAERIIELDDGAIRFTHPLLASVLYQGLSPQERRQAHRRLAELADEPLIRARHVALSADEPDAELASELEHAARTAVDRGTPIIAAELGEHALRLTPPGDRADADRRATATARAHLAAGESARARMLAEEFFARASPGVERARALFLMAAVETEDPEASVSILEQALPGAVPDSELTARIHCELSGRSRYTRGLGVAEEHARTAVALAEGLDDDALRATALARLAVMRFNAAKPDAFRLAEAAYGLVSESPQFDLAYPAGSALAHVLTWSFELDRARALLEHLERTLRDRDELLRGGALWYLAIVEIRACRLDRADHYARLAREIGQQYGPEEEKMPQDLYPITLVAAHRGELDRAHALAELMVRHGERHATRLTGHLAALGVVELWRRDAGEAAARFAEVEGVVDAADSGDPGLKWWRAEQIEALLELGRIDDAVVRLEAWETDARRLGRSWVIALATRCRGLVAAARGDLEDAASVLEDALVQHEAVGDPFGRGRTLLALGIVRQRAKQKRAAREALEAAAAAFEALGAAGWAARSREELGRIGGRTRSDGLTQSEGRVAELVVLGRTNAEVAAALFLSERTVASHLTHVYAKLGVRSRTELARKLE